MTASLERSHPLADVDGPFERPPPSKRAKLLCGVGFLMLAALAFNLLQTTPFWAAIMFAASGYVLATARAFWVPAVLAGLYTAHYNLVQDVFGDGGPFIWRNWMAVGFAITFLLGGFALNALFTGGFQRMPVKNRLYLVLLSVTMALSMITFGPRSFQSQDDPWQFNREWLLTLLTCAFISFVSSLRLRAFLWTLLGLGLVGLVQVPAYLHTSMGANVSASMVLGVFAAVFLFTNPWVTVAISTPLIIGTLILMKEGAVVGLMVGGFTLLLLRTRGTRLSWLPYLGATAVVAAGVAVWVAIGNARLWDQILHRGMDVRLEVYRDFLRLWLDSPIIGLWQVSPAVPRPADMYAGVPGPIYAHNPILEALGSWGLVGLALWASLQAIAAMAAHRTQLLPLWAPALAFAMSSGDLAGNPRYWIVGAVAVAVAISGLPVRRPPGPGMDKSGAID